MVDLAGINNRLCIENAKILAKTGLSAIDLLLTNEAMTLLKNYGN